MANIAYNRLFNTRITHTFYEGGISKKDLAIVPTESTVLAMKNSKMLFRQDEEGFRVLYKADDTGGAFISFSNVRLVFALQLLNLTEFLNFSNLNAGTKIYSAGKILYFTNIGSATVNSLSYSLIDYLRPVTFTYQFPQTAGSPTDYGSIVIKDQVGNPVTPTYPPSSGIVPDSTNHYTYPIDFTKLPKGLYQFITTTTSTSPTTITETIYVDTDLARQGVFGIVDILAIDENASNYPGIPGVQPAPPIPPISDIRVYDMNFVRRLTQWKYIVVLKSPSVNPSLPPIIIQDDSSPIQPEYGMLSFTTQAGTITVNGFPAKVITSNSVAIPYFEEPKKGLSIKDTAAPATIVTNIQGPPIGVVSADPTNFNITEIFVTI